MPWGTPGACWLVGSWLLAFGILYARGTSISRHWRSVVWRTTKYRRGSAVLADPRTQTLCWLKAPVDGCRKGFVYGGALMMAVLLCLCMLLTLHTG